ncbi:hypothetical protein [Catenulispora subtropica]|uniref:Peptidase S1 domain-containing protein n=1 Tax=Catenulispora subtropica TaxID=450798 RepID=A0ABN2S0L0_9ACTN
MAIGTVALSAALGLIPAAAASGDTSWSSPKPATFDQFAAQPFDQQASVLQPLRAVAGALDDLGRGSLAAAYGDVVMDPVADTVTLYATSPAGGAALVAQAKQDHPEIDTTLIRIKPAAYSKAQLHAARDRLAAQAGHLPYQLVSVAVAVDGSGLEVGVDDPAAAKQTTALAAGAAGSDPASIAGVPVVVSQGSGMTGQTRYADTSPYYAGGLITSGGWDCTTGIPVANNSGGGYAIITASHCAHTGAVIYNGGGAKEGTVSEYHENWDAAKYPVSASGAYEFDGSPSAYDPRPLSGTKYSYNGDSVCQDGYTSGVICGIQVVNQDVQNFMVRGERYGNTFAVRGVIGRRANSTAVRPGDSGGLVFAIPYSGATVREVRGIVSASVDGHSDEIFWTEALDIYNTFHVHLV